MKKKVFMFLTPFARLIKSNLDMRLWWEEQENSYPVLLYGVDVTNLNPNIQDDSFVEFADENLERELFHAAIEGAKVLIAKKGGQERDYISGKDIIDYFISLGFKDAENEMDRFSSIVDFKEDYAGQWEAKRYVATTTTVMKADEVIEIIELRPYYKPAKGKM